jgi:hypothetical protein
MDAVARDNLGTDQFHLREIEYNNLAFGNHARGDYESAGPTGLHPRISQGLSAL